MTDFSEMQAWRNLLRGGEAIEVRTAFDNWIPATTLGGIEPTHRDGRKIHDFLVVYVTTGDGNRIPWPLEDIRPAHNDQSSTAETEPHIGSCGDSEGGKVEDR